MVYCEYQVTFNDATRTSRDFFSILGKRPFGLGILSILNKFSLFAARIPRIAFRHIILYHLA